MLAKHLARGIILLTMLFSLALVAQAIPAPGTAPVAANQHYRLDAGNTLTVSALANGLLNGAKGAGLTVAGNSSPTNGTLDYVNANGSFSYTTPDAVFTGTDSFTYTITDGTLTSQPATVTITIIPCRWPRISTINLCRQHVDGHGGEQLAHQCERPEPEHRLTTPIRRTGTLSNFDWHAGTFTYTPMPGLYRHRQLFLQRG